MHGIIKAMLIKTLLENDYVVGYTFKKMLKQSNIEASNGAIYYNLKKFEEKGYVISKTQGKRKIYSLTKLGKAEFNKNIALLPENIKITMEELGSQIPFINWQSHKDVQKFHNSVEKLNLAIKKLLEELT
ncbi:MAG: PadR family transcriptional regulator [Candidatus Izemoplasmataceae bacterium]